MEVDCDKILELKLKEICLNNSCETFCMLLRVEISSYDFARDGVTTVSFHRSVFISMRWKDVISRY